jgi:hypothetical protein
MERPTRFEHTRFLGDKRTQLVYDLDEWEDEAVIDEIVAAEVGHLLRARHPRRGPQPWLHLATPGVAPDAPQAACVKSLRPCAPPGERPGNDSSPTTR